MYYCGLDKWFFEERFMQKQKELIDKGIRRDTVLIVGFIMALEAVQYLKKKIKDLEGGVDNE